MASKLGSELTHFTRDVVGRYICNTMFEAQASTDPNARPDLDPPRGHRPDAKPFDLIIIGGGSFGAVVAQHLYNRDSAKPEPERHRILVLDAGLLALAEHVQNMPMLGLNPPGATRIADLRAIGQDGVPRNEVWGLAWHSATPFVGLAYCLGGRSTFFGGWTPQLLDKEMPIAPDARHPNPWPESTVSDLDTKYFSEAAEQIGTDVNNDFIRGPMHEALRKQLFDGINANKVPEAIPLSELPTHLNFLPSTPAAEKELSKLEAPLAVQSRTRTGFFPVNKFSTVPLLITTTRQAESDSGGDDIKKRLMLVADSHVRRLVTQNGRVTVVQTSQGDLPVPDGGVVIIATGTIESTRLAKLSFENIPNYDLLGQNLMAHLRSNLTIRVPRGSISSLDPAVAELQASALFVKGRHAHADGSIGHFHLQITAAGLQKFDNGTDSEAELFKKIPDIDTFDRFQGATDDHIVIAMRGIGETHPQNNDNFVRLDPELDEYGVNRAFVGFGNPNDPGEQANNSRTRKDAELWDAMDKASDDVARVFANGNDFEILLGDDAHWKKVASIADLGGPDMLPYTYKTFQIGGGRRDGLGTTHHEAGPLWMGDDPTKSVTNANGHFHHVENAYAIGPALFPSVGSPNPMLTGVALARRLADHLADGPTPFTPTDGFTPLFDGSSTANWRMAGGGNFIVVDGVLEAVPGSELGLYWCTTPTPANFVLRLEWLSTRTDDNSGVFVRFPHPDSKGYLNTHFVAVDFGFEIQIDDRGYNPDTNQFGDPLHQTGAIYTFAASSKVGSRPLGQWNEYEIRVDQQNYTVSINGADVTNFAFAAGSDTQHPDRGLPSTATAPRFVGLQSHTGRVLFRNIRIKAL